MASSITDGSYKSIEERKMEQPKHEFCQWFLLCDRPATCLQPHPVLPPVPICDKCLEFLQKGGYSGPKPLPLKAESPLKNN